MCLREKFSRPRWRRVGGRVWRLWRLRTESLRLGAQGYGTSELLPWCAVVREGPIEISRGGVLGGRVGKGRLDEAREVVQVGLGRDGRDRNLDEEETDGHEGVQGGHVACTGEVRVFKLNLFNLFWWF